MSEVRLSRTKYGEFYRLHQYHRQCAATFVAYYKMSVECFDELVFLLRDRIQCRFKTYRGEPNISPEEKLTITLRHLGHGLSCEALSHSFLISSFRITWIISEVCGAICNTLRTTELAEPTIQDFATIACEFYEKCDFPHCLGAIDAKHIAIKAPASVHYRNKYRNYKGYYSVILFTAADVNLRFRYIDVIHYGQTENILRHSSLGKHIYTGNNNFPKKQPLPGDSGVDEHFFFVATQMFPLQKHVMRSFGGTHLNVEQRIFNERLFKARRTVDNALGILTQKFEILTKTLMVDPKKACLVVTACCLLHNFIRRREGTTVTIFNENLHVELDGLRNVAEQDEEGAVITRQHLKYYVNNVNIVPL